VVIVYTYIQYTIYIYSVLPIPAVSLDFSESRMYIEHYIIQKIETNMKMVSSKTSSVYTWFKQFIYLEIIM